MPECTLHEQFSSGKSYRVNSKIKVLKVLKAELFLWPPFVIAQLFKTNNFNNCVWKECLNIDRVSVRLDILNDAFVLEKMKPSYFDSEKLMIIGTGGIRCFDLNTNFGSFPLIWYSTLHFFDFLITSSKWALFNNSVICPWWPWCQQSNYIRHLMFKVWIMHDVWFLNRRRVLKTPHPIFIFFYYFSFKGSLAFCLYKFESPLKGCYRPSHLSLLFRWAKKVRSHNVYICFF